MKKNNSIGKFHVTDFFYRVEFQQRGAPHIHSLLWLADSNGKPAPRLNKDDQNEQECVDFIDSVLTASRKPDDADLANLVETYLQHNHTFTCNKGTKKKTFCVKADQGHGKNDGKIKEGELDVCLCRFDFPRFPMKETRILHPPSENELGKARFLYWKIKSFLCRQLHKDNKARREAFLQLTYDAFLAELGLTHDEYVLGVRGSLKKGSSVFPKRECNDVFTTTYNKELLFLHRANMDFAFITDGYACASYVTGYLLKAEKSQSVLLKQISDEAAKNHYNLDKKLKNLQKGLDQGREVGIQEAFYRVLGLQMCVASRLVK